MIKIMKRLYRAVFGQEQELTKRKRRKIGSSLASEDREGGGDSLHPESTFTSNKPSVDKPVDNTETVENVRPESTTMPMAGPLVFTLAASDKRQYTDGNSHFMMSHDGVKECAALFLSFDSAEKLQTFMKAERALARANLRRIRQNETFAGFRKYAEPRIKRLNDRRKIIEDVAGQESRHRRYGRMVNELRERLDDAEHLEREATRMIQNAEPAEYRARLELAQSLEQVLVSCKMLEKTDRFSLDSETVERFRVPEESNHSESSFRHAVPRQLSYEKLSFGGRDPLRRRDDELSVRERSLVRERDELNFGGQRSSVGLPKRSERQPVRRPEESRAVLDEEMIAHRAKVDEYWDAHRAVRKAQAEFDDRAMQSRREVHAWQQQHATARPPHDTRTDLDLRHVFERQQLARELIEAEAHFAKIKAKALEAGMDIGESDRSSGFVDGSQDGRDSCILPLEERYNRPKVEKWLADMPDTDLLEYDQMQTVPALDEWGSESVYPGESSTLVADGNERRRIDKWRQVCDKL